MAKRVALFNHKGGVSKTTTTFNLGWMLAEQGHRVVMVDADPQCNLSGMVLGYRGPEQLDTFYADNPGQNLWAALAPAFTSQPKELQPVTCLDVPGREGLFLLPGHIAIEEYEVTLGIAQELSGSIQALANLPGSIPHLLDLTAAAHNADVVLIDMSPGLGSLNQNLLTTADHFVVPTSPDYFSVMALDSLGRVLPKWQGWATRAAGLDVLKNAAYPFPEPRATFAGTVIQRYRPRLGSAARAFEEWIADINRKVKNELIPTLASVHMAPEGAAAKELVGTDYCLAQIADFNSLIAKSQKYQTPVFALTDEQLELVGKVLERTQDSREAFREVFEELGRRFARVIGL